MAAFRTVWLLLALVFFGAISPAATQSPAAQPSAQQEPITPVPAAAAQDPRRVALGEQLFQDRRLSHDNTRSCSTCHDTRTNGASANARDATLQGEPLPLNTLTIFNAALNFRLNWEANVRSLEHQAEQSINNSVIMGSSIDEILAKLEADPETVKRFQDAYARGPGRDNLLDAIAAFERSLITPGSRFDRWLAGDAGAITSEELSGYQLFKSLGCISCHQGVNIGGNLSQRHGVFVPIGSPKPELVRVPSLRNVATTAPYFHDGSMATLPEAVKAMGKAQLDRALTEDQITGLVAFLKTLTGAYKGTPLTAPNAGALHERAQP